MDNKPTEYRQGDGCIRNSDGTYQPVAVGGTNALQTDRYVDTSKAIRDYVDSDTNRYFIRK